MIKRINYKNTIDVFDFLKKVKDTYEDMYITENKERIFLKDLKIISKIIKSQEVYVLEDKEIKAILIIYRSKGYRPYVKLLSENSKYTIDMLKFLKWTFFEKDLYFKLKKENPLSQTIIKTGFVKIGDRGRELLFFKKGLKQIFKITPKDLYLVDEENRLY
jgi:hypothetical protein